MAAKYKSKLAQEVGQYADLIKNGRMLAIDPSSGSAGSLPGYALFEAGRLVDAGTLGLPRGTRALSNRLYLLRAALASEFPQPDILAVELIAPVMPTGKGHFLYKSASSLLKSVGAILSVWDVPVIEPSPATWHSMTPPNYVKSDTADACMLGWATLITLARVLGEPEPTPTFPQGIGVVEVLAPGADK